MLMPATWRAGLQHVEPHHFAGAEVDQDGISELAAAADVGRAEADDAAGDAEHLQRHRPVEAKLSSAWRNRA